MVKVIKPGQVPMEFELATYQFECDALTYWANALLYLTKWQRNVERFFKNLLKGKGLCRRLDVVFTASELKSAIVSSSTFLFWFVTIWKKKTKKDKGFQNSKIVNYPWWWLIGGWGNLVWRKKWRNAAKQWLETMNLCTYTKENPCPLHPTITLHLTP